MKILFWLIQFVVILWANVVLPDGYSYVAWVVAIVWGLSEYFSGLIDGENKR